MLYRVALLLVAIAASAAGNQEARQAVTQASNAFAFDLYELIRREPGNLIMSPVSAATVLAMTYTGAGGATASQMRTALHLPEDAAKVVAGFRALVDSLQNNDQMTLRMANKVYADRTFTLTETFQRTAVDSFRSGAERLDFRSATEAARLTINGWVEEVTDSKIKDLIKAGSLDPLTVMVLVNAIYFRGTWWRPFYERDTRQEAFHVTANSQVNVPMMHRTADFRFAEVPSLNARALELPYLGGDVKMLILLPNTVDGLPQLESQLRQLNLTQLSESMAEQECIVTLPKFTIESTYQLHDKLKELGMVDLFREGSANLTGITPEAVHVSKVVQKAFVEVNENGTVAAAATVLEIATYAGIYPPPQPITFTVDHPFMFFLLAGDNTLLFLGRIQQP